MIVLRTVKIDDFRLKLEGAISEGDPAHKGVLAARGAHDSREMIEAFVRARCTET
jgi:hypothetical protein